MKPLSAHRRDTLLLLTLVVAMATAIGLSRWIDTHRPAADSQIEEEKLYLTGRAVKRASLAFNGLVADWYWMRSLQYVGKKILNLPEDVQLENLSQLDLKLLAPLLDNTTELDPEFLEPYEYAAVVLPAIDVPAAIRITRKGITANPSHWRLYQHLGYIYWQQHDFKTAGEVYAEGAKIPGVPAWMEAMRARMEAKGGSRDTAREIYIRMYEQSEDKLVKEMARRRLLQLDSDEILETVAKVLRLYKSKVGRCPASWREVEGSLRASRIRVDATGAPLDPAGTPYLLGFKRCEPEVDWRSEVPSK